MLLGCVLWNRQKLKIPRRIDCSPLVPVLFLYACFLNFLLLSYMFFSSFLFVFLSFFDFFSLLDAFLHLYSTICVSVRPSVHLSVIRMHGGKYRPCISWYFSHRFYPGLSLCSDSSKSRIPTNLTKMARTDGWTHSQQQQQEEERQGRIHDVQMPLAGADNLIPCSH